MSRFGEPLDDQARAWRDCLLETMQPYVDGKLPLLLSGGVDSGTLLAACLELGHQPDCYGYALNSHASTDLTTARKMTTRFGCAWTAVFIPQNLDQLMADVREVITQLRTSRKTAVQCAQPIMHLARQIKKDGFDSVLAGTGGVALDGRAVMVKLAEEGEEAARELRAKALEDRHHDTGTGAIHRMARLCGVEVQEPLSDEPLKAHALALDMADLSRGPKGYGQKGIAVRAFPDFWMGQNWYRRNSSLQVNGGIRDWHEELLTSPLNPNGAEAVVAVYNRILKDLEEPTLGI